ncbi:MAG: YihY/virulence factor BrkB family protein [Chloroflexi bacterium]|nr:YihY/virulence factor BrkB family protein [Chloroflexota bacterium]
MKERLTNLKNVPLLTIALDTFNQWRQDNTERVAGALAYFSILSLAPVLLIMISLLGLVTDQHTIEGEVYQRLSDMIGPRSADLVQDMVIGVNESQAGGIAAFVGMLTLGFGAVRTFAQLQEALNTIWGVEVKPEEGLVRLLKRRVWAAAMLPVTGLVVFLALVIDTALGAATQFFTDQIPSLGYVWVLQALSLLVFTTVLTFLFAVIYRYLPDVDITWEDVFTGAAVTAVLFAVGQFLLSIYLARGSISSTYGAAGTFMVVLLWVYYSAQIFLFGAEFTQVFARRRGKHIEPASYAYSVDKRRRWARFQEIT